MTVFVRIVYSALWWVLTPVAFTYLLWRSRKQPAYRQHWGERLGFYRSSGDGRPMLWIHAVSVGETRAAQPLVKRLIDQYPKYRVILTHMTPTGRETAQALFGDTVTSVYLPYDHGFAMRRFVNQFRPTVGVLMETEVWPRMADICKASGIPLFLVNARLSERSFNKAERFAWLTRPAMGQLAGVLAQTASDADRLTALGAHSVKVMGNLKFDASPDQKQIDFGRALKARFVRPVVLFAATREGEERLLLDAWVRQGMSARALCVVVPRHPQRFNEVAGTVAELGLDCRRRSESIDGFQSADVWLGDSMGEMAMYYAFADLAYVGGSLLPFGGQNLIEACAIGCPVLLGPHTFNFDDAAREAVHSGAALRVADAEDLMDAAARLLGSPDERAAMSDAGRQFALRHRGAADKAIDYISGYLSQRA